MMGQGAVWSFGEFSLRCVIAMIATLCFWGHCGREDGVKDGPERWDNMHAYLVKLIAAATASLSRHCP